MNMKLEMSKPKEYKKPPEAPAYSGETSLQIIERMRNGHQKKNDGLASLEERKKHRAKFW